MRNQTLRVLVVALLLGFFAPARNLRADLEVFNNAPTPRVSFALDYSGSMADDAGSNLVHPQCNYRGWESRLEPHHPLLWNNFPGPTPILNHNITLDQYWDYICTGGAPSGSTSSGFPFSVLNNCAATSSYAASAGINFCSSAQWSAAPGIFAYPNLDPTLGSSNPNPAAAQIDAIASALIDPATGLPNSAGTAENCLVHLFYYAKKDVSSTGWRTGNCNWPWDNKVNTRIDFLIYDLIEMVDTTGSKSIDAGDDPGFRYNAIYSQFALYPGPSFFPPTLPFLPPPSFDVEFPSYPAATPTNNDALSPGGSPQPILGTPWPIGVRQHYCETNSPTSSTVPQAAIRLNTKNSTDWTRFDGILRNAIPASYTPITAMLRMLRTHPEGFPSLLFNTGNSAPEDLQGCRKDHVILITDGEDTCEPSGMASPSGGFGTRPDYLIREVDYLRNLTSYTGSPYNVPELTGSGTGATPKDVRVHVVGFADGLTQFSQKVLNTAAAVGGTDADQDQDHIMNSSNCGYYGGTTYINGTNSGTFPGGADCDGNAYLVNNSDDLAAALRQIISGLQQGEFLLHPGQIITSGQGSGGVIASSWETGVKPSPSPYPQATYAGMPWRGRVVRFDFTQVVGNPLPVPVVKWDSRIKAANQAGTSGFTGWPTYTSAGGNTILELSEANVNYTSGPLTQADFFAGTTPQLVSAYDFDENGQNATESDAKSIIRWLKALNTPAAVPSGSPAPRTPMRWQIGAKPDYWTGTEASMPTTSPSGGTPATGSFPYGSIVRSNVVNIHPPDQLRNLLRQGYASYVAANAFRPNIAVFGTNNGSTYAVHDFVAGETPTATGSLASNFGASGATTDGNVLWAYFAREKLRNAYEVNTRTIFYHDGPAVGTDINFGTEASPSWGTIYLANLGEQGGRGLFSLNLSDTSEVPGGVGNTGNGNWEISTQTAASTTSGIDCDYSTTGPQLFACNLGFTGGKLSRFTVADVSNNIKDVLAVPSGRHDYADTAHPENGRVLFFVDPTDGSVLREIKVGFPSWYDAGLANAGSFKPGVTTEIEVLDTDGDGNANFIFVGNDDGQIWRFRTSSLADIQSPTNLPVLIFDARNINDAPCYTGNGNTVVTAAEGNKPRSRRVMDLIGYTDLSNNDKLIAVFGDSFRNDEDNERTNIFPMGAYFTVLESPTAAATATTPTSITGTDCDPITSGNQGCTFEYFNASTLDDPFMDQRIIPNTLTSLCGGTGPVASPNPGTPTVLPSMFGETPNHRAIRYIPDGFVLSNFFVFALFVPDDNLCQDGGDDKGFTYLVAYDFGANAFADLNAFFFATTGITPPASPSGVTVPVGGFLLTPSGGFANYKLNVSMGMINYSYIDNGGQLQMGSFALGSLFGLGPAQQLFQLL